MAKASLNYEEAESMLYDQPAWFRHVKVAVAYVDQTLPTVLSWRLEFVQCIHVRHWTAFGTSA
jgi:hypothetical protein